MSQRRGLPTETDIGRLLRDRVEFGAAVGLTAGVVDAQGELVRAARGTRGPSGRPVDAATVFEIGSLTKLFTATLLADFAIRGIVSLDEPVAALLPSDVRLPARGRQITLADLATHTAALPRLPTNLDGADTARLAEYSAERLYDFLSHYELPRDVGAEYEYSNIGYELLGHALALRAGSTLPDLISDRILTPIGMRDSGFARTSAARTALATPHDDRLQPVASWDPPAMGGSGGMWSTADDMLRFAAANLAKGNGLPEAMALARTPRFVISPQRSIGLGWHTRPLTHHVAVWHSGETAGSRAFVGVDATTGRASVVLSNCVHPIEDIGCHLLDARMPLLPPDVTPGVALPMDLLARYAGVYQLPGGGSVTVNQTSGGLVAAATGLGSAPLYARSPTDFYVKVIPVSVTFELDGAGRPVALVLHSAGENLPAPKVS